MGHCVARSEGRFVRRFDAWSVYPTLLNYLPPASEPMLLRIWLSYFVTLSSDCLISFLSRHQLVSNSHMQRLSSSTPHLSPPFLFLFLLLFLLSRSFYLRVMKAHDGASSVQPFQFVNVRLCQYFFAADFPFHSFIYWTDTMSVSVNRRSVRDEFVSLTRHCLWWFLLIIVNDEFMLLMRHCLWWFHVVDM